MKSQSARRLLQEKSRRQQERYSGKDRAAMRFGSSVMINALIPDPTQLPSVENTEKLQNDDGTFTFLEGFSAVGGPDL